MILMTGVWTGQFQGETSAQTPIGSRRMIVSGQVGFEVVGPQQVPRHLHVADRPGRLCAGADRNPHFLRHDVGHSSTACS